MTVDRDKLRVAIRRLGDQHIYYMLDDAIEMLPPSKLTKLAGKYLDVKELLPEPRGAASLLAEVQGFEKASLRAITTNPLPSIRRTVRKCQKGPRLG